MSHVFYTVFAHLFAIRDQLDNQDESSLSPQNVARELGFSEEAEPCDMRRENQRRETDQSSRQEYGYAMLTPRTTMVIFKHKHPRVNNKTTLSTLSPLLSLSLTSLHFNFNYYISCVLHRYQEILTMPR